VLYQRKHLCERFHRFYDVSFNEGIEVEKVARSFGSCMLFRRTLWGDLVKVWFDLLHIIHNVTLREGEDRVTWKLGLKGLTVKSLYNALHVIRKPVKGFRQLWNMNILGKIKTILWTLMWGKL
jgi:hypothetical protein